MSKFAEFSVGLVIFLFLFFALFLFFFQKGNKLSKNLLGMFFLSLGLAVADVFLSLNGTYTAHPQFAYILSTLPLVYGPLLWLFTISIVNPNFELRRNDIWHFLPFALFSFLLIIIYHVRGIEFKKEFIRRATADPGVSGAFFSFLILLSIAIYIYKSHQKIVLYRARIKEEVSNVDKINLGWLEFTLAGFAIIMFFTLILQIIVSFDSDKFWFNSVLLILLFVMLLFVMGAIVKGMKSDIRFISKLKSETEQKDKVVELSQDGKMKLLKLNDYLITEAPYLNPSISLGELADQTGIVARELSFIINKGAGASFFDYINSYRIKHAQELIRSSEDEKMTILEVMYKSGFNSKSSFNTAFKKHAGMTPTQWKLQVTDNQ